MTDDNELNHHNDPAWLLHSIRAAGGDKPYLGNTDVVDAILRTFVAGILERFEKVGHGILTPNDAAEADKAECVRLGGVFTGADGTYAQMPKWTDGGLAEYVRDRMGESVATDEPDADVLAQAFASLAHTTYGAINDAGEGGNVSSEQLDDAIRSMTWLLCGIESNE